VAGDAVQPAGGFGVGRTSKAASVLERLRERLSRQVPRDLHIEGAPQKEREEGMRMSGVELREGRRLLPCLPQAQCDFVPHLDW
jgi:hypothetical protein